MAHSLIRENFKGGWKYCIWSPMLVSDPASDYSLASKYHHCFSDGSFHNWEDPIIDPNRL